MFKKAGKGFLLVVLGSVALVNTAAARWAVPMVDPAPTEWTCNLDLSKVQHGIEAGLKMRAWTASAQKPGHIKGKIVVRGKHTLVVDITYDASSFDINYISSINLKYFVDGDGLRKIHPNANSWMENLRLDITSSLNSQCH